MIAELFISIFAGLIGLLASIILIGFSANQKHARRLLAFVLFAMAVPNLMGILFFYSGLLLKYPLLYRMPAPFTILIWPAAYFYVRAVLREEWKLRKYDWMVLILFLLHFINMLPYFRLPFSEKEALIKSFMLDKNRLTAWEYCLLPDYFTPFVRLLVTLPYLVMQIKLLKKVRLTTTKKLQHINVELLNWLQLFTNLMILQFVASLIVVCVSPFLSFGISPLNITIAFSLLLICLKLYFKPQVLYGLHIPTVMQGNEQIRARNQVREIPVQDNQALGLKETVYENPTEKITSEQANVFTYEVSTIYKQKIETLFENKKPYLDKSYSLEHLVKQTGIPRHLLSAFINREYGMGFREFLNGYRINYLIENAKQPVWQNLTLEAIGGEVGFQNRTTFIRQFKAVIGKTPSEFFNKK
jgi:AraC-like DNA-binding protein